MSKWTEKFFNVDELSPKHQAGKITFIYLLLGFLWILLSDKSVELLIKERSEIFMISIIKGSVYVIITGFLIFYLVSAAIKKVISAKEKIVKINAELEQNNILLDKSNTLFSSILESSPEIMVFALDSNYCYLAYNHKHKETMYRILGEKIEIGMYVLDIIETHLGQHKTKEIFDRALAGESFSFTESYEDDTVMRSYWQSYYSPVVANDGKILGLTCFLINITARVKAEEENIYLSFHDALTGLYNRRFYETEISRLDTERNLPISIVIGDLNGLKIINDAFGHQKGDALLIRAAALIKNACRTDDIIARWGGDEFVLLLPKTEANDAEAIVKRIQDSFSSEYVNAVPVSISFGWDTKQSADQDILKILKSAEDHMYKHKIVENASNRGNIIGTIINTLHEKSPREEQHSKRVAEICLKIGKAMNFSETDLNRLKAVGLLHDIGKIAIDENILNKRGRLTEQEYEEVKRHPEIGFRILSTSYEMQELAECVLSHHERWDGKGYPKGLKGEAIPKIARIIALVDSYDAMTSERPYRKAMGESEVLAEIRDNAGTQFDPEIARIFIEKVLEKPWKK